MFHVPFLAEIIQRQSKEIRTHAALNAQDKDRVQCLHQTRQHGPFVCCQQGVGLLLLCLLSVALVIDATVNETLRRQVAGQFLNVVKVYRVAHDDSPEDRLLDLAILVRQEVL